MNEPRAALEALIVGQRGTQSAFISSFPLENMLPLLLFQNLQDRFNVPKERVFG